MSSRLTLLTYCCCCIGLSFCMVFKSEETRSKMVYNFYVWHTRYDTTVACRRLDGNEIVYKYFGLLSIDRPQYSNSHSKYLFFRIRLLRSYCWPYFLSFLSLLPILFKINLFLWLLTSSFHIFHGCSNGLTSLWHTTLDQMAYKCFFFSPYVTSSNWRRRLFLISPISLVSEIWYSSLSQPFFSDFSFSCMPSFRQGPKILLNVFLMKKKVYFVWILITFTFHVYIHYTTDRIRARYNWTL